jgi:sulfoxide reductase catalytic subunit YedY
MYRERRRFIRAAAGALGVAWLGRSSWANGTCTAADDLAAESPSSKQAVTHYNNYYEFSTNKEAVHLLAQELTTTPWEVVIDGEVETPLRFDVDALHGRFGQEERIYRLRCVEGWSMVVPWNGFPLCALLRAARPTSRAKYVAFHSLHRPAEMIGQRRPTLSWPYLEALGIDEAMHPLTFVATGLYGQTLPKQNGAPARIVVPWKYGFKSPKAITRVELIERQPRTSWQIAAPSEYGFLANVNPNVAHPRWSQRREVRIGELKKRRTELFNGYAEQVAGLYAGIDLVRNY